MSYYGGSRSAAASRSFGLQAGSWSAGAVPGREQAASRAWQAAPAGALIDINAMTAAGAALPPALHPSYPVVDPYSQAWNAPPGEGQIFLVNPQHIAYASSIGAAGTAAGLSFRPAAGSTHGYNSSSTGGDMTGYASRSTGTPAVAYGSNGTQYRPSSNLAHIAPAGQQRARFDQHTGQGPTANVAAAGWQNQCVQSAWAGQQSFMAAAVPSNAAAAAGAVNKCTGSQAGGIVERRRPDDAVLGSSSAALRQPPPPPPPAAAAAPGVAAVTVRQPAVQLRLMPAVKWVGR